MKMKTIKKTLLAEDGASSVLVMITMIVLIAFGLASFSLALSNERLADKKIAWLTEYYQVESQANLLIAEINAALQKEDSIQAIKSIQRSDFNCSAFNINQNSTEDYTYTVEFSVKHGKQNAKYIDVKLGINADNEIDIISFKQRQDPFEYTESPIGFN